MKSIQLKSILRKYLPFFVAILSFTILIIASVAYTNFKKDTWEKDIKSRLYEIMMTKASKLEIALYSRIHYTRSVAAYVSLKPSISADEFHNLAKELIRDDSVISTMAISKDCTIDAIYPIEGHEEALGLDLLSHPERREIVEKTIETQKTFVAGPVHLVEGGVAFISYTPIFDKSKGESNKFWGVTDIVIYKDMLLREATLHEKESGFLFALKGYNGSGNEGDIWWGNENVFTQNPLQMKVQLPYGNWVLAAVPEAGWSAYYKQEKILLNLLIISSLIISFLIGLVIKSMDKIKRNELELKAIFNSMNSTIFEFDEDGRYIKIPTMDSEILIRPADELINKTIFEVLPKADAVKTYQAIQECLKSKKLVVYDYPLLIGNNKKWFHARVSYKSESRVIFNVFDISEQKESQTELIKTGKKLKELNASKDKLFSIIAHDLKNPFNVILGYSNLLNSEYHSFNEVQRKEYIEKISTSSQKVFTLLENLLAWAASQIYSREIKFENIQLKNLVDESINPYLQSATDKKIQLNILIPSDLYIYANKEMIRTVISNLFSNAVKFTEREGNISISAMRKENQVNIKITDTGVGIESKRLAKLFKIEENTTTQGTENEKGTGLGLVVCHEFIIKNNGSIRAESKLQNKEKGKEGGSVFSFSLPVQDKNQSK
jgi:PAS domain S-box-containing protein